MNGVIIVKFCAVNALLDLSLKSILSIKGREERDGCARAYGECEVLVMTGADDDIPNVFKHLLIDVEVFDDVDHAKDSLAVGDLVNGGRVSLFYIQDLEFFVGARVIERHFNVETIKLHLRQGEGTLDIHGRLRC